jgi:hypothetical protein
LNTSIILTVVPETVLLMQSFVSILNVVVYHLCSVGTLHEDVLVDLWGCWHTCQESEEVVFMSVFRTIIWKWNVV